MQSAVSIKRGEFPTQNAVVYNTVPGPAAFIGALAKFAKISLQLRHVCPAVHLFVLKKESDKKVFITHDTGQLIKSVHIFPLCLRPVIIIDQTL